MTRRDWAFFTAGSVVGLYLWAYIAEKALFQGYPFPERQPASTVTVGGSRGHRISLPSVPWT